MTTIKIENNYSSLQTDDDALRWKLWKVLRFKDLNYFHKSAYKMRVWDGYVEFFKRESGRFLTGLLPEVKAALTHWSVPFQENDERKPLKLLTEEIDKHWLSGIELRDYQVDYINQSLKHKRGVVYSPTGSGKTLIMVGILKAIPPKTPTVILCNQQDLVDQNYEEITKFGFDRVGRVLGGCNKPDVITCMTWQSWAKYKHLSKYVRVLLIDEIHLMMSTEVKAIYRQLDNCGMRIGMSATPFKHDGKDSKQKYETKGYIGPAFFVKSVEDGRPTTKSLQARDILSEAEMTFYKFHGPDLPPHLIYVDAITHGIAENQEFHDVVTKLTQNLKGRTLVIVERIKQGDYLHDRMPNAIWVRGKDNRTTRKMVRERLKYEKGDLVAIATGAIFTTGINVFVNNLVNAAGGKAYHTVIQRLGRGLRKAPDKNKLLYFDFYFQNNNYLENHSEERIKAFKKEGHNIVIKELSDIGLIK